VTSLQAVLLPVGDDVYAVPVGWVREVTPTPALSPLVTAPPVVLGLFNLRGEIVPLLDTAALLGVGAIGPAPFVLVLDSGSGLIGLAASGLPQRVLLDRPVGPSEVPGTIGSYRVGDGVAVLLDPGVVLGSKRLHGPDHALSGGTA
jgi:chemotaxis protein histidine kinase CheA